MVWAVGLDMGTHRVPGGTIIYTQLGETVLLHTDDDICFAVLLFLVEFFLVLLFQE